MADQGGEAFVAVRLSAVNRHFYQYVRQLLNRIAGERPAGKNELLQDSLEMVSPLSLEVSPTEVSDAHKVEGRWRITVWQRGLVGALGALPTAYTQWLIDRYYTRGERAAKAFLDLFTHRLQVLRFLVWEKSRCYARAELRDEVPLSTASRALSGVLNNPRDEALLSYRYASLLAQPVRSLTVLESWIQQVFDVPVVIRPFTGSWQPASEYTLSPLGAMKLPLGHAPMLGGVRWEPQSRFALSIGPVGSLQAQSFMPGRDSLAQLHRCLQYFVGADLGFDIEITIHEPMPLPAVLGKRRLGMCACLGQGQVERRIKLPWELVT